MSAHYLSIHIDRPQRLRVQGVFSAVMQEVTTRTQASFGATIVATHHAERSRFAMFVSVAHRRGADGKFIMPENPDDHLYDANGKPLHGAMGKSVPGLIVDAAGRRADDHGYFPLSPARYAEVQAFVESKRRQPGLYNGIHDNCVRFALTALEIGGITLDTSMLPRPVARLRRPEDIGAAFAHQPQRHDARFVIAQPRLLGR